MRFPIPPQTAERLRELMHAREVADAEARGILTATAWMLGIPPDELSVDDGPEPALIMPDPLPPEE